MLARPVVFTGQGAATGVYAPKAVGVDPTTQPQVHVVGFSAINGSAVAGAVVLRDGGPSGTAQAGGGSVLAVGAVPAGSQPANLNVTAVTNTANATVTTSAAHGLTSGQTVVIAGIVGATGANGTWANITVLSPTTFQISNGSAPGVWSSGGTVTPPFLPGVADVALHNPRATVNGVYVELDSGAISGTVWVL